MKKILMIISAAMAILFSFSLLDIDGNKAKAASIGEQLKEPEMGWKRYDDSHPAIIKKGYETTKDGAPYNGSYSYTPANDKPVLFDFTGDKVRIIVRKWNTSNYYAEKVELVIDGKVEQEFSIHGPTQNQTLIAEVTGLENKRHKAIIRVAEGYTKGINLDAIDLDADGTLIHPDTEVVAESLKLNKETLELTIGSSETLIAMIEPENAINKNVLWTSSDSEIASVDDNGNVIGKKAGKVTITATTTDGSNLTATAMVTVKEAETGEIGNRVILRLTTTNKDIHEYDLSLSEIDQFMNWLDGREVGQGKPYYKFKLNVTTGNIISRTEYIMYDKIVSFTIDNYK
ncbi:Ig-like domain-containing protein [Lysinibacillus sphaericus]|uniref:Ig-like domain-containing protein n=2 Tax=Lysinibacillus sphaericus TaxID=1421 RepID=UPI001A9CD513|nr:Ig-like domain-containing protein [Lysinibacillus sphaericus]QTB24282.1 Ig domain-containing protein [Lysinibacillus sphaericus]